MAYKIRLTSRAESDAYAAYDYIREDAPMRAETWLRGLFKAVFTLEQMPRRCKVIPEAEEIGLEVRQLLYGRTSRSYRILFDIQEDSPEGPRVRILRIWHGSRDSVCLTDL